MLNGETKKIRVSKKKEKKKQMNLSNSLKSRLISQIQNPLNSKLELNQETQFNIE